MYSDYQWLWVIIFTLMISGCKDENGTYRVGVSLGGTGTGTGTISPPKPTPTDDKVLYALAYPNPVTQYCNGMERTIQFVSHYAPFKPMIKGDRMDLLSINNSLKVRYKLQVIVKNTTASKMYEYIDSCSSAFQLIGSQTEKSTQSSYCLNDETVNEYQPNETRTYYYTFNLPNILQNWTASYKTQYSNQLYASPYEEDNLINRSQCSPLTTTLVIDEYPSSMDIIPNQNESLNNLNDSQSESGNENSNTNARNELPVFAHFGLDEKGL